MSVCKICGRKTESEICDNCQENFPSPRQCSSCGRVFPEENGHFNGESTQCVYCQRRKRTNKRKREDHKVNTHSNKREKKTVSKATNNSVVLKTSNKHDTYITLIHKGKVVGKINLTD